MLITLEIPNELATRLAPLTNQLPRILELGLRELNAAEQLSFNGAAEVLEIVKNLGDKQVIKSSDGRVMARDLNGARGILLRVLGDSPELQKLCSFANPHDQIYAHLFGDVQVKSTGVYN